MSVESIEAEMAALEASDKKNPAKAGQLRKDLIVAQRAEISSLQEAIENGAACESVSTPGSPASPAMFGGIDWAAAPAPGQPNIVSELEQFGLSLAQFVSGGKPASQVKMVYLAAKQGIMARRVLFDVSGIVDPHPILDLKTWPRDRDPHTGEKKIARPEPIHASGTKFETEAEAELRRAAEGPSISDQVADAMNPGRAAREESKEAALDDGLCESERITKHLAAQGIGAPGMPAL